MIRYIPDNGRVGAGQHDETYRALGFHYVATFQVIAEEIQPFRREMWADNQGTSLTIGPSGLSGAETALQTVGIDGTIVRTFTVEGADAGRLPRALGLRRSGLFDEVLVSAEPAALLRRHRERVAVLIRVVPWPLRTLDDELRLSHRTSALLGASGRNTGVWLLRFIGAVLAGGVGMLLGLCGLPPATGWLLTGGSLVSGAVLGLWLLFSRRWMPGPLPARTAPETWPTPTRFGPALEREFARGPLYKL